MIERTNLLTLGEIALNYQFILIDNSVLYHSCFNNGTNKGIINEDEILEEKQKFLDFLIYSLEEGIPLFLTSSVSKEHAKEHYPYKKIIKHKEIQQDRRLLELCRKKRESSLEGKRLFDRFEDAHRILILDETERDLYKLIYEEAYSELISHELGEVDNDFLVSGVVISRTRGNTCLVSNDFGIFRLWKYLSRRERINQDKLNFAIRIDVNSFKFLEN